MSQLFDFGFTATFSRIVSFADSGMIIGKNGEFREADRLRTLGYTFYIMNRIYVLISLFAFTFVFALTYSSFYNGFSNIAQDIKYYTSYVLAFFATVVVLYSNSSIAALTGLNQIERYKKNELLISVASIAVHLYLILFIDDPILNIILYSSTIIANSIVNMFTCEFVKKENNIKDDIGYKWNTADPLTHYVLKSATQSGFGVLMSQGLIQYSVFYVAQVESSIISSSYSFAMKLYQTVMMFANIGFYNRLPDLARLYIESRNEAYKLALKLIRSSALIYAVGITITQIFVITVIGKYDFSQSILPVATITFFSIGMIVERVNGMLTQLYTLSNDIVWHKVNFIYGTTVVLTIAILTQWVDLVNSIAISHMAVSFLIVLPLILSYCKKVYVLKVRSVLFQTLVPGVMIVIFYYIASRS